jgi:hypothetical protein
MTSNDTMIVNDESERTRKESVVTCFKVLAQKLPGGTVERD